MTLLDLVPVAEPKAAIDYWRQHRVETVIWPQGLAAIPNLDLTWKRLRFTKENRQKVSTDRGIYAFSISIENPLIPPNGYIVYVGITGARRPRNLRIRYGDYLRDQRVGSKRVKIREMFSLWSGHLDFWFAACPDPAIDLEALEKDVNTALIPPFVEQDFHDWARPMIKILRSN